MQRYDPGTVPWIGIGLPLLYTIHEGLQLCLPLNRRHSVSQPAYYLKEMHGSIQHERSGDDGNPQFGRFGEKAEISGHDADDRVDITVEGDRLPEDVCAPTELAPPEPVTDQDDVAIGQRILRHERPPQRRRHAKNLEKLGGDQGGREPGGLADPRRRHGDRPEAAKTFERAGLTPPLDQVWVRDLPHVVPLFGKLRDVHEPLRPVERERGQEDGLDHAEHGRIRPDADRQRHRGYGREAGMFA